MGEFDDYVLTQMRRTRNSEPNFSFSEWVNYSDKCAVVEEIQMPSKLVGCPTFGGPNLTDIFITSSSVYLDFNTGKSIPTNSNCRQSTPLVKTVPEDGSLLKIEQSELKGVRANKVCLCND